MRQFESLGISKELYDYIKSKKYEVSKYYYNSNFIRVGDTKYDGPYYLINRIFYMIMPASSSVDEFKTLENEFKTIFSNGVKAGKYEVQNQLCALLGVDDKITNHCYDYHD